ncbi:MAG: substrate-binding domain-containing protein, partial [Candidatus Geothermincolia bacterium]
LSLEDDLNLEILYEGDKGLFNQYHVMEVNPEKWPNVNNAGAKAFVDFCVSMDAQEFLNEFGVEKYGGQLFFPDAL